MKDVNCFADAAAGNADIGEQVVIKPVEHFGRGVAALPLAIFEAMVRVGVNPAVQTLGPAREVPENRCAKEHP